jgi:hypothetical protein
MIGESGGGATGAPMARQLSPGATNQTGFGLCVALQCGHRSHRFSLQRRLNCLDVLAIRPNIVVASAVNYCH